MIHGINLGPMRLIFVELSCLQAKIFMLKSTPWPRKIGQSHPYLYLTKTLLGYIHGISLAPMWLIFVELSCLQAKIANFHVEIDPPWPQKIGQGHLSSNLANTPRMATSIILYLHVWRHHTSSKIGSFRNC